MTSGKWIKPLKESHFTCHTMEKPFRDWSTYSLLQPWICPKDTSTLSLSTEEVKRSAQQSFPGGSMPTKGSQWEWLVSRLSPGWLKCIVWMNFFYFSSHMYCRSSKNGTSKMSSTPKNSCIILCAATVYNMNYCCIKCYKGTLTGWQDFGCTVFHSNEHLLSFFWSVECFKTREQASARLNNFYNF